MERFDRKRSSVRDEIKKYAHTRYMNRSHYLKWPITKEWSIRYFFNFDRNNKLNKKFVLKSHYTKDYIELTRPEALDYIQELCPSTTPQEYFSLNEVGAGYRRLIMDPKTGAKCFMERMLKSK